jgi:hypothetical protein
MSVGSLNILRRAWWNGKRLARTVSTFCCLVWAVAVTGLSSETAFRTMSLPGQDLPGGDKEASLGREMANGFRRQAPPIDKPAVQKYLDYPGQRIAPQLPGEKLTFTFSLYAGKTCRSIHEPTTFPGGWIFVPAGLFLTAQDESEFAGIVTHAMLHAALRHRARPKPGTSLPLIFTGWAGSDCSNMSIPPGFRAQAQQQERRRTFRPLRLWPKLVSIRTHWQGTSAGFRPHPPNPGRPCLLLCPTATSDSPPSHPPSKSCRPVLTLPEPRNSPPPRQKSGASPTPRREAIERTIRGVKTARQPWQIRRIQMPGFLLLAIFPRYW